MSMVRFVKIFFSNKNYSIFSTKFVLKGNNAHPLYKWLKTKQGGFLGFDGIKWNFTKFLVDKDGQPIKRYAPNFEPKDIEPDIDKIL